MATGVVASDTLSFLVSTPLAATAKWTMFMST